MNFCDVVQLGSSILQNECTGISDNVGIGMVVEEFGVDGIIKIKDMVSLDSVTSAKEVATEFALKA